VIYVSVEKRQLNSGNSVEVFYRRKDKKNFFNKTFSPIFAAPKAITIL
jgi:hypothetical protein